MKKLLQLSSKNLFRKKNQVFFTKTCFSERNGNIIPPSDKKPSSKIKLDYDSKSEEKGLIDITLKDFIQITKFRLSLTNSFVAFSVFLLQKGLSESPMLYSSESVLFLIATQSMAMASQVSNQSLEGEYDKLMMRTCNRPVPKNRISPQTANQLAAILFTFSNLIFLNNFPYTALIVANTIFLSYTQIYTPMKRESILNTLVGAISGSLTPYLGWAAAGGSFFSPHPLFIMLYMLSWQYSHFYGILWIYKEDYQRAGFKMIENKEQAVYHLKLSFLCMCGSAAWVSVFLPNPYYVFLPIFAGSLYQFSWKPIQDFNKNPNVPNAKKMKIDSYKHLSLFFIMVYISVVFKYFKNKNITPDNNNNNKNNKK